MSAFTALEVFIRGYVDAAAARLGKDDSFWKWLINRDDDVDRQPSIADLFDQILYFLSARSLKTDSPGLWQGFHQLKRTRNRLVHGGHVPDLHRRQVIGLIQTAREVIDWVRDVQAEPRPIDIRLSIEEPRDAVSGAGASILKLAPDTPESAT